MSQKKWNTEAKGVLDFEKQERRPALTLNGKLLQSGQCYSEHLRIDCLEAQPQDQDELCRQDCNRACQREIRTWNHAGKPYVCCESLAIIVRQLKPD